jgi:hypothetical protein
MAHRRYSLRVDDGPDRLYSPMQRNASRKMTLNVIDTTHDLAAASAALDAAIAQPKRGQIGDALAPLEPKIRAALKANMTPTAIAKLLKANGVNASLDGLRAHVKAVADGKKPGRGRSAKSNGKPADS